MAYVLNPFTGKLDATSGGGTTVIAAEVSSPTALPVTLGTPAIGAIYLATASSGVWLVNYKPAGLYKRTSNDGDIDDWSYLGPFDGKFTNDVEITGTSYGFVSQSPNGSRWRLQPSNSGLSVWTPLILMLLASAAPAQTLGIGTLSNGVVATDRTNVLTWSNAQTFNGQITLGSAFIGNGEGLLAYDDDGNVIRAFDGAQSSMRDSIGLGWAGTNAATTITNLFTNNAIPAFGAPEGAVYTVVGGQYAGVASRFQFSRMATNNSRTNWTNNAWNDATNNDTNASISLAAGSVYRVSWNLDIQCATNTQSWGYTLAATATFMTNLQRNGLYQHRDGFRAVGWDTSAGQSTAVRGDGGGQVLEFRTNMDRIVGGNLVIQTGTNAATLYFRWWPGTNTNQPVTLTTNSWLQAEKLN
jgi:hypothetical protein